MKNLFVLQPPKTSLLFKFPSSLKPVTYQCGVLHLFIWSPLALHVWGPKFHLGSSWGFKSTIGKAAKRQRSGFWERDICMPYPKLAINIHVARGVLCARCLCMLHECGDTLKMLASLMNLFHALCIAHCIKEEKWMVVTVGWPLLWAVWWPEIPN